MVHISVIQSQLTKLGIKLSRWFTPELRELQHIMMDHEKIIAAAPGRYFNGFALLVATDLRLLLIDKRSFFMMIEDTRYDMISEVDFSSRFYDYSVRIYTLNKQHNFSSVRYKNQLRDLCTFVQQRVWELRQVQEQIDRGLAVPSPALAATRLVAEQPAQQPQSQAQAQPKQVSPPLATTFGTTLPHNIHVPHPSKPHLPKQIGFAAMNGTRRYTPPVYTNHLVARSRSYASE